LKIIKNAQGGETAALTGEDLELINRQSRKTLTEQEVYAFSVRLCDNEVDRDGERFAPQTLEELAGLFVGKSGIFDHQWSSRGQAARIYKTQVVQEPERTTKAGDGYCWLKGWAYMLRTESNRDLIAEIEGGIKKEVSVGCAVERCVCSICGADRREDECGHRKGERYDGQLCYVSLEGARDAYEFSFVAVPAQPQAGVVKGAGQSFRTLKELTAGNAACRKELERLEEEAKLGRDYLAGLRDEVVRLGLLSGLELDKATLCAITEKLGQEELAAMKKAYGAKAAKRYPVKTQLHYGEGTAQTPERDKAFLI
jgi:hypothetical protein